MECASTSSTSTGASRPPMTVTIQQDVMFPAFTVCSSREFSRRRVEELGLLNRRGTDVDWKKFPSNASVETFWREAGTQRQELIASCNRGACSGDASGEAPAGRWTPLMARNGMCYTFVANQTLTYFNKKDKYFVDVYFHGSEPPIVQARYFNTPNHPKVKVQAGDITTAEVTGKVAVFKSLTRRYCDTSKGYTQDKCYEKCMWAHESQLIGCRAPWMVGLAHPLPLCNTSKQFYDMQSPPAIPRGSVSCPHCPPSCSHERYSVQVTTTMNAAGMARSGIAKLMAVWPYQQELSTEEKTYGLSGLISDVGGNMSLLLGVSVISIAQLMEMMLRGVRSWLHGRLKHARARTRGVAPSALPTPVDHYIYTPPSKNVTLPSADITGAGTPPPAQYQSPAGVHEGDGYAAGGERQAPAALVRPHPTGHCTPEHAGVMLCESVTVKQF
ncbi:hypothetical protein FJT64_026783 [Amphibalanus amphitrite]|uniref:Acid-sensing ion channel 4 n=1 Tax=Amphibalanus amphitrite TaxID=1232801 RepID=A0A6A4WAH8_AMPAM|nr:hypothetical protein FJT64_026783 [Amphibalanus amphitrite]